jgi:hypothetical protein
MRLSLVAVSLVIPVTLTAQDVPASRAVQVTKDQSQLPLKYSGGPTSAAITAADLMTRIYKFADDSMMGREAGTPWNDKATDYIAAEVARLGLKPGGDNGTYFQHPLVRRELTGASFLRVGGQTYEVWRDWAPRDQGSGARSFYGATAIFGGTFGDTSSYISPADAAGKVVIIRLARLPNGSRNFNVNRAQLAGRFSTAAAVVVTQLDHAPAGYMEQFYRPPQVGPRSRGVDSRPGPSYLYVTDAVGRAMLGVDVDAAAKGHVGRVVNGAVAYDTRNAPGRNVIAILPGSDASLRGQYVAIGAHNDHVGFSNRTVDHDSIKVLMKHAAPQGADSPRPNPIAEQWKAIRTELDALRALRPARLDSIYNGADDDASGSMAVLEIAEALARAAEKPKRSVIFIWHVAEELGLFGSEYFTDNPTVPRDSIVAQLNMDMVGRGGEGDVTGETKDGKLIYGGPGYLQLIGSRRLSTELGDLVEKVNGEQKLGFRFDYSMDANGHPQNIYCRSDHYEYARYGIPIVFFTTGGHADYHQVTDEPQYVDYERVADVSKLVLHTALRVANLGHRVKVDQPKPDPRGRCQQ